MNNSMNAQIYLSKFNEQMEFFCNYLSNLFRNDPDVLSNISLLRLFQKSNARKVSEFFYSELLIYEREIHDMNEKFFVELSKKNLQKYSESKYGNEICQVIDMIHAHLNDSIMFENCLENDSENNKTRIWKYLKVLLFLTKKIHEN